jgi:hypothetical protein
MLIKSCDYLARGTGRGREKLRVKIKWNDIFYQKRLRRVAIFIKQPENPIRLFGVNATFVMPCPPLKRPQRGKSYRRGNLFNAFFPPRTQ